jgi:hypothetical protein
MNNKINPIKRVKKIGKREAIKDYTREEKLNHYANLNNEITMNDNNSKTGKCVLTCSFPAKITCRKDSPCAKTCYCLKGMQTFPTVLGAYKKNYRIWQEDAKDFFDQVTYKIKHNPHSYVRWFDSGDIPTYDFFLGMVETANKNPNVFFLSFTKQYEFVNSYLQIHSKLPKNLTILFSAWNKYWKVPNPHNLPMAFVKFQDQDLNPSIPTESFRCPTIDDRNETCSNCKQCWFLKENESVYFHQH